VSDDETEMIVVRFPQNTIAIWDQKQFDLSFKLIVPAGFLGLTADTLYP
jgi:hypothetical protein